MSVGVDLCSLLTEASQRNTRSSLHSFGAQSGMQLECNLLSVRELIRVISSSSLVRKIAPSPSKANIATGPHRAALYSLQVSEPFSEAPIVSKTDLLT